MQNRSFPSTLHSYQSGGMELRSVEMGLVCNTGIIERLRDEQYSVV